MRRWVCATVVAAAVAGCASTPPEEDPVQQKLGELDSRLARLERIAANQTELAQRVDTTQDGVRELRGRLESLEHREDLQSRQRAEAARTAAPAASSAPAAGADPPAAAGGAAAAPAAGGSAAAGAAASSVEQTVYSQAFDALKAGSYSTAITGFTDFLKNYPGSPLAENAQYWLGEAYYVNHDYDSAAAAFQAVPRKWPNSRKAPDALLKLGLTQFAQKQYPAARATLTDVTRRYPGTDSARLAAERLSRIPQ